ncbi:MAG: hypothetical protein QME60_01330 [Verrucomicrobiota bacterium]|nr:hypothetical protein [Verrucomicrobiota bacterium]
MLTTDEKLFAVRLEESIEFRTKRAKRLARVKELAEHPGWKALREDIEDSAKTQEAMNAHDLDGEEPADFNPQREVVRLKRRAAAARAYRGIVANVEHADDKIAALNDEIVNLKQKLDSLHAKASATNTERHRGRVIA